MIVVPQGRILMPVETPVAVAIVELPPAVGSSLAVYDDQIARPQPLVREPDDVAGDSVAASAAACGPLAPAPTSTAPESTTSCPTAPTTAPTESVQRGGPTDGARGAPPGTRRVAMGTHTDTGAPPQIHHHHQKPAKYRRSRRPSVRDAVGGDERTTCSSVAPSLASSCSF